MKKGILTVLAAFHLFTLEIVVVDRSLAENIFPSCGCPDLALTETFQSRGLGYVGSPEFAEAVVAVANGVSGYSPVDIPPEWRSAAKKWIVYLASNPEGASDVLPANSVFRPRECEEAQFFDRKDACNSELVHLASLEYRKAKGREDIPMVPPDVVPEGTMELAGTIAAKRKLAPRLSARAELIGSMILEAERLGAGKCLQGEVARAKRELELAFREARMIRSDHPETVASFDRAERTASFLLEDSRDGSDRGMGCWKASSSREDPSSVPVPREVLAAR
jgi:hypothetical protein